MENIYQEAISAVEGGANFKVDFASRSLKVNGRYIIKNGEYEGTLGVEPATENEVLAHVEDLYLRYKHSLPSERSESKSRRYFVALPERKLDNEDMMYSERRDKAQIELELYLLCQILQEFRWDAEKMGNWFWQSNEDKDLVILREWVEPNNHSSNN